jgi:hypothetical protein
MYKITAEEDGQITWTQSYQDCVSAVHAFDQFKDYGVAKYERIITLIEPSGQRIVKTFTTYYPVSTR